MDIQQNRFPMGKSGGTNWWPWIILGGGILIIGGVLYFRRDKSSSVMPGIATPKEEKGAEKKEILVQEQPAMETPVLESLVIEKEPPITETVKISDKEVAQKYSVPELVQ